MKEEYTDKAFDKQLKEMFKNFIKEAYSMTEIYYNSINFNDSKQIDHLLHDCLNITEDITNKYYDEDLIDVIEKLADKLSDIRCIVNPVYKQICDDINKSITESME